MEKIVLNLLSNAYKFTMHGKIQVELTPAADTVQLTVADTGSGIPKQQLAQLVQRFHRIEGAQGRTHEGSGIGLALVDELSRLHQSSASVESELGVGSKFTVTIPCGSGHLPPEHIVVPRSRVSSALGSEVFTEEASCGKKSLGSGEKSRPSRSTKRPAPASSLSEGYWRKTIQTCGITSNA